MISTYFSDPFSSKRDRRFTITLLSLCIVYVMPIILANRYYIDDLGRSQWGYASWSTNGRPLADFLMILLGFGGENIVDISPLTLIFSVLVFVFSAYYYFKSNFNDINPVFSAVIFFFAFANPFLLENLSYKFDSLPMVMALCLLMFAFVKIGSKTKSWLLSIFVIIASLCLYQAAIGFFVCLAVMEYVQQYAKAMSYPVNVVSIYKSAMARIVQLLSAYVVYATFIAPKYVTGDYNITHSKPVELNAHGFCVIFNNIHIYFSKIVNHFGGLHYQLFVIFVFLLCCLFSVIYKKLHQVDSLTILGHVIPSAVVFFSPLLILLSSFLHVSLLAEPVFADRTLISFSGVMFFAGWVSFYIVKRWRITSVFVLPIVLFFFVFSYSYGNALKAQNNYDAVLSTNIVSDLNRIDLLSSKDVVIYGIQPSSPARNNAIRRYPLIESLVPLYMSNDWYWGGVLLNQYGMKNKWGVMPSTELLCAMTPFIKSADYTLLVNKSTIVIAFTKPNCN